MYFICSFHICMGVHSLKTLNFPPQVKDMHGVRLTGDPKLASSVNMSLNSCLYGLALQ